MKPFWIVWCPQSMKPPKFRHETEQAAVTEAERLATENPGKEFFVMESACLREVMGMRKVELRPDIPF